jgi:hypothetical protein
MTVRKFGQGRRHLDLPIAAALVAAGLLAPAAAQQSEPAEPTPAPSSIFRLPPADDGRAPGVQGPSDNGLPPVAPGERRSATPTPTPAPTPQPVPPRVIPTQPPATTAPPQAGTAPPPAPRRAAPADGALTAPTAQDNAPPPPTTTAPTLPELSPGTEPAAAPMPTAAPADEANAARPAAAPADGAPVWAWILAALAALGTGVWYWRRRPALAGDAGGAAADPLPRPEPAAPPPPTPRAAAVPAARPPEPRAPQPVAPPIPATPRAASPLVNRAAGERRAVVGMALDIGYIRLAPDHVAVGFSLHLINQGILPATGLMVRIALNQGSAMPEPVLARFFDGAGGSVLRDDMMLAAGAGEVVASEVMLPRAAITPLMIGGKPMLVPVIAFDVTYHWDGEGDAFGQNAGSYVLGREQGNSGSEKLAPLPLDRPSHEVDRPGARATAIKRSQ